MNCPYMQIEKIAKGLICVIQYVINELRHDSLLYKSSVWYVHFYPVDTFLEQCINIVALNNGDEGLVHLLVNILARIVVNIFCLWFC